MLLRYTREDVNSLGGSSYRVGVMNGICELVLCVETGFHSVALSGFDLIGIHVPLPSEWWD